MRVRAGVAGLPSDVLPPFSFISSLDGCAIIVDLREDTTVKACERACAGCKDIHFKQQWYLFLLRVRSSGFYGISTAHSIC